MALTTPSSNENLTSNRSGSDNPTVQALISDVKILTGKLTGSGATDEEEIHEDLSRDNSDLHHNESDRTRNNDRAGTSPLGGRRATAAEGRATAAGRATGEGRATTAAGDCMITMALLQLIKWKDSDGNIKELQLLVHLAPKWKMVFDLLEFEPDTTEAIETTNSRVPIECIRDVILLWKDRSSAHYPHTWNGLCLLLKNMKLNVYEQYLNDALRAQVSSFKNNIDGTSDLNAGNLDNSEHINSSRQSGFKCPKYQSWKIWFIFIVLFIYSASLAAMYCGFTYVVPHPTILAMAGHTIDCDKLKPSLKKFLSEISLIQKATDHLNDNPQGLFMKVKSFERTDISSKRQIGHYSGTTNKVLNNRTMFSIPDQYYAYPLYLWAGSNITVRISLSNYATPPKQLTLYLIYGDQNYNLISENPSSMPIYEQKFDLFGWDSNVYRMTVQYNGYYYIICKMDTDNPIHFFANVNFVYYYVSDLCLSDAHELSTVGRKLTLPLDYHNEEIVVCAVDSQTDLSAYTIHIFLNYSVRGATVYTIPLVVLLLLPLVVALVIGGKKLAVCCSRNYSTSRPYQRLNIQNTS